MGVPSNCHVIPWWTTTVSNRSYKVLRYLFIRQFTIIKKAAASANLITVLVNIISLFIRDTPVIREIPVNLQQTMAVPLSVKDETGSDVAQFITKVWNIVNSSDTNHLVKWTEVFYNVWAWLVI